MAINNAMSYNNMKYESYTLANQTGEHPACSPTLSIISNIYLIQICGFTRNAKFLSKSPLMLFGPKHNNLFSDIVLVSNPYRVLFTYREKLNTKGEKKRTINMIY